MSEFQHTIKTVTDRHANRVQQALADTADSWDLAYGQILHEVLDRLGRMKQVKLPVWLILDGKISLHQETDCQVRTIPCQNISETSSVQGKIEVRLIGGGDTTLANI
jgi:hypothetical protein